MSPNNPLSSNIPLFIGGGIFLALIIAYSAFAASPYLLGPSLMVQSPEPNSTLSTPTVQISGATKRVSYLSVDDQAVPLGEDGTFHVERAYPAGYTVLVVRARDRFGREAVRTINFVTTFNPPLHVPKKEVGTEAKPKSN